MTSKYNSLTFEQINSASAEKSIELLQEVLAERATITGGGMILRWSEYNENPDPLINELLARILISKLDETVMKQYQQGEVVLLSIENSAAYLVGAVAYEMADVFGWDRPARIIRARKIGGGSTESPAMGESKYSVSVVPITSAGQERHLMCSMAAADFAEVRCVIVVDDFKATGNTLHGGKALARKMFGDDIAVVLMAGLGKPEQEANEASKTQVLSAIDVAFWPEDETVLISVNGHDPQKMVRAKPSDFVR